MALSGITVGEMEFISQMTGQIVTESHLMEVAGEDSKYFPEMHPLDILDKFFIHTDEFSCGNPAWTGLDQVLFDDMPEEIQNSAIRAR